MTLQYILMDIEGTVSPIPFVHKVLFPYSRRRLKDYVDTHADNPTVQSCLDATRATALSEDQQILSDVAAVDRLLHWIDTDRKHPALKTLQGLIWREGYEGGEFISEIYADVYPVLAAWQERGLELGIYSSGSVQAQILLFKYTDRGDMTPFFSHFFDTAVGGKRDPKAYTNILAKIAKPAASVLFLSDIAAELEAAQVVGIQAIQLVRPGTSATASQRLATDFYAVDKLITSHLC